MKKYQGDEVIISLNLGKPREHTFTLPLKSLHLKTANPDLNGTFGPKNVSL